MHILCCMPAVTRTWRAGCGGRYKPGVRRHARAAGWEARRSVERRVLIAYSSRWCGGAQRVAAGRRALLRHLALAYALLLLLLLLALVPGGSLRHEPVVRYDTEAVVRYDMEPVVRYNMVPVELARLVCSACSRLGEPWHAPSLRSRGADVGRGEPSASADIGRGEPSRGADACLAPAAARAHLSWHANAGDVRPRRGARASEGADGSALSHIHRGTGVHMGSPPHGTGPCLGGRVPRGAGELHGVGNEAHVDDLRGRCWAAGLVLAAGGDRGRSSLTLASCWSAGTAVHADT